MTLHAKNGKPSCINFLFIIFYFPPPSGASLGRVPPSDAPVGGGGGIFSGKEDGCAMTQHTKNGKPGCISFRFMNFYSQRGDTHPSDAPEGEGVIFFSE